MVIENFIVTLAIFSEPKSFYEDPESANTKVFKSSDIENLLNVKSSIHFNRGEDNFISGHGKAAYAYWAKAYSLTDEEIAPLEDNPNEALRILIRKLRHFIEENKIDKTHLHFLKQNFDLSGNWKVLLSYPHSLNSLNFEVHSEDMQFLASLDLEFGIRHLSQKQVNVLKTKSAF